MARPRIFGEIGPFGSTMPLRCWTGNRVCRAGPVFAGDAQNYVGKFGFAPQWADDCVLASTADATCGATTPDMSRWQLPAGPFANPRRCGWWGQRLTSRTTEATS